ncbi:putative rho/rac guanine nucleotide exchange factor/faciogenital dysplasia protein 3, partial [Globisporangium splendens]
MRDLQGRRRHHTDREDDDDDVELLRTPRPVSAMPHTRAATRARPRSSPSSRRSSFTGGNSSSGANHHQGSFVASFAMSRKEQTVHLTRAKSYLPQLIAECARDDSKASDMSSSGSEVRPASGSITSSSTPSVWKRVKSKKKSTNAQVWEKESVQGLGPEFNTATLVNRTDHSNSNHANDDPWTTTASAFAPASLSAHHVAHTYAVRSSVTVPAQLDVVLKALDCSAVSAYRSFTKIIYESLIGETSVLFHSHSASSSSTTTTSSNASSLYAPSESLAVRWLTCRCNNPMVSDCDFCLLEYTKVNSVDDLPSNGEFQLRSNNNNGNNHQHQRADRSDSSSSNSQSNQDSDDSNRHDVFERSREGLHSRKEFPSAYKILYSIETKSCPELFDMHRIARCTVPLGGFLFYPTDNSDVTDVVFYMVVTQDRMTMTAANSAATANSVPIQNSSSSNPFSAASSNDRQFRAVQKVLQHMARGIDRIKNAVDAYSMSLRLEILRDNTRWVRNTDRAECVVCFRRFHQLTRRRHHCRMCGDVICRDCSVYKDADLPDVGPTLVRICKLCELNELKHVSLGGDSVLPCVTTTTTTMTTAATTTADAAPQLLVRKRSATISVDTSKAIAHEHEQQPDVGRRFTTVVDGKERRELPEQAFSTPKPDIMDRRHKWNTGGGGKPIVIFSPSFATHRPGKVAFAPESTTPKARSNAPQVWDLGSAAAAAAIGETGEASSSSSSSAAAQPPTSKSSKKQPHSQANSCSKLTSKKDRFTFTFRTKESRQEENNHDEEEEEKSAVVVPASALPGRPSRAIKEGKLVSPMHDGFTSSNGRQRAVSIKKKRNNQQQNNDGEDGGVAAHKLVPRKLPNVHQYEDILLTLCEQVSNLLNCKYAAVSIFTASPSARLPTHAPQPGGGVASPASHENYTTVHFLKAEGRKKLGKVSANMKCCAPMLELKGKIIARDTLAGCNLFDFKKLPIVMGPQQVRFYAGIPLVDPMIHQMVGAFAVFDSGVYRGSNMNEVLPTLEAFAAVALDAIEDRKTDLELQSFLQSPLVDTRMLDNQSALRLSEPVLQVDKFLSENDGGVVEYDREQGRNDSRFRTTGHLELAVRPRFSTRPRSMKKYPEHDTIEFYKKQMEKLVRQARDTEAQVLENSMAMKRHGVVI